MRARVCVYLSSLTMSDIMRYTQFSVRTLFSVYFNSYSCRFLRLLKPSDTHSNLELWFYGQAHNTRIRERTIFMEDAQHYMPSPYNTGPVLNEGIYTHLNDNGMNTLKKAKLSPIPVSIFDPLLRLFCLSSPFKSDTQTNGKNKFICWISLMDLAKKKNKEEKPRTRTAKRSRKAVVYSEKKKNKRHKHSAF